MEKGNEFLLGDNKQDVNNLQKFLRLSRTLRKILFAAPDKQFFQSCNNMFKAHGLEVSYVFDGRACFSAAMRAKEENRPYDFVILSVDLPVLDGFSTAMLLKDNDCSANIISVSEEGIYWHDSDSENAGCDLHLQQKELPKCVATWLQAA